MKMKATNVKFIQEARTAGLDMREVSERLDAAAGDSVALRKWRKWVRSEILKRGEIGEPVLGH